MAQSVVLYRGQTTATPSNSVLNAPLFTLGSGIIAAKIIFGRLVVFNESSAILTSAGTMSIFVSSAAGGDFVVANGYIQGDVNTRTLAFAPPEQQMGTAPQYYSGGTAAYAPGVLFRAGSNAQFNSPSVAASYLTGYNSGDACVSKIFWAGPSDTIRFTISNCASVTMTINYLFTAITET